MSAKKRLGAVGIDNTFRKTWDKTEYAEKAKEREEKERTAQELEIDERKRKRMERDPLHQGIIVQRANLRARETQIDLVSKVGKTQMHSLVAPLSQQAGFYCEVCDCILKDSHAYLDHINGKWHNRALGMSMRVEKSSVEEVRQRLLEAKRRKKGELPSSDGDETKYIPEGFDRKKLLLEEEYLKSEEEEKKRESVETDTDNGIGGMVPTEPVGYSIQEEEEDPLGSDEDAAAIMGFSGFGGSKKT